MTPTPSKSKAGGAAASVRATKSGPATSRTSKSAAAGDDAPPKNAARSTTTRPASRGTAARATTLRAPRSGGPEMLGAWDRGDFPASIYLEGPSEALKMAWLSELKRLWKARIENAAPPRVFRAAESSVEEILAAVQGASLFNPRDLVIVLDIETLGRSEKKVVALADGIARSGGEACLALVESAAEAPRKTLEPLRRSAQISIVAMPPGRAELLAWGARRLAAEGRSAEPGVLEALADACEGEALAFFSELAKLASCAGAAGPITQAEAQAMLRPTVGAELPEYVAAVALGHTQLAAQRLGRILAAGVGEGQVMFSLANLVCGALGGWSRFRDASEALRRRSSPAGLTRALDAVYRAESAWKSGRADVVAVLEQATRDVCAA